MGTDNRRNNRIMDVTLRDGGLVNDFRFTDDFVSALYEADCAAGVDMIEFGYKASKRLFSPEQYGEWKFCEEQSIERILNKTGKKEIKISVMADVGRTDYRQDITDKQNSVIDIVRVASYSREIMEALSMIEYIKAKGYYVTCNIMALSTDSDETIRRCLALLGQSPVDGIYIVDSYGAFYPDVIRSHTELFMEYADKYGKEIGIHAHNNQQLAFANTITAYEGGASLLDASMSGMGRGAGNCGMELLLAYLKNGHRRIEPVLQFVSEYMEPLRQSGIIWGYDTPYLISGMLNQHPRTAIAMTQEQNQNYVEYYHQLTGGNE